MRIKTSYVLGTGVDIIKTTRFKSLLTQKNEEFINKLSSRILHHEYEEPKFIQLRSENNLIRSILFISGSWAAKEALFKTLNKEDQRVFQFKNWYRYYNEQGKPFIRSDHYGKEDEEFLLSISHDDDILIASVLRQRIATIMANIS